MLLNQFKACSINLNAHHMNGMTREKLVNNTFKGFIEVKNIVWNLRSGV